MALLFKTAKETIIKIDEFYDHVEEGLLLFTEGVENYLAGREDEFQENFKSIDKLEGMADKRQMEIENEFYIHSLLPQFASDVINLLEQSDELIDVPKINLGKIDVERPEIPEKLTGEFMKLTRISVKAGEYAVPGARMFFKDIKSVREKLNKVYFYERETDKLAMNLKKKVFEMKDLDLSRKIHLREFALYIETISDKAKHIADLLSLLAIKVNF